MSTPYERLMAEAIPVRPAPADPAEPRPAGQQWTPEEQARHWNDLGDAIANWHWHDETRLSRHLRLVETDAA